MFKAGVHGGLSRLSPAPMMTTYSLPRVTDECDQDFAVRD